LLWTQNHIPRFRGSVTAEFKIELTNFDIMTLLHISWNDLVSVRKASFSVAGIFFLLTDGIALG